MVRRREKALMFPEEPGYPALRASVVHRVGFSEVDPMGIVWFGRYAVFFEEASAALRDGCGLSNADFFRAGIQPPVIRYEVEYLRPSRLDERLTIAACMHGTEAARMNTTYEVRGPDGELRVVARTVQVFMDMAKGAVCLIPPPIWRDCLKRWRNGEFACLQA